MTIPANRFGRAGGPSLAQIKEFSTLQTSSSINAATSAVLLPDTSALPGGDADSYYLLWGVTATTTHDDAFFGIIYDSVQAHAASTTDAGTYLGFGANNQGPFFWNTEQPVQITPGSGLKLDKIAGSNNTLITVVYSVVHAGV
tara:strand:+ start:1806 stop:2234 length:429 start_codon:yes stop_codon:yes gene_type:complete